MLKTWNGAPEVVVARHRLHKELCTFNLIKVVERCNNVIDTILELMVDVGLSDRRSGDAFNYPKLDFFSSHHIS